MSRGPQPTPHSRKAGANVILAEPHDPVVFERTIMRDELRVVSPSQLAADLLTGPGREPSQGNSSLHGCEPMRTGGVLDRSASQPVPYCWMPWLHSVITAMPSSWWEHRRSTPLATLTSPSPHAPPTHPAAPLRSSRTGPARSSRERLAAWDRTIVQKAM
jgi:hypothetical protein